MNAILNKLFVKSALVATLAVGFGLSPGLWADAAELDFGKPGEPIKLVVGHPCCYTQVWSVMALRGKELWKKYLPKGSTVDFEIGLQGSTTVNSMLADKVQIGYIGDMPSIVATTKQSVADIRIVAVTGVSHDQINILMVRKDAPQFKGAADAVKWLDGKQFAAAKGTASDMFARFLFAKEGVRPAAFPNQNIEVITSGFRSGKLDGAAIWEPVASRLVYDGMTRRIVSGFNYGIKDSSYMIMSAKLIKQRPDVVKAWLNAELDAELYMADENNSNEMIKMVMQQTAGFPERSLWNALYATYPDSQGGTKVRIAFPFVLTPEVIDLLNTSTSYLRSIKAINIDKLRPDAVMPEFGEQVLKERHMTSPVGEVVALPDSAYKGK